MLEVLNLESSFSLSQVSLDYVRNCSFIQCGSLMNLKLQLHIFGFHSFEVLSKIHGYLRKIQIIVGPKSGEQYFQETKEERHFASPHMYKCMFVFSIKYHNLYNNYLSKQSPVVILWASNSYNKLSMV